MIFTKKKSKAKEESKVIVKIDDKPRSSVLKLPYDMQPQNSKITFDSDSDHDAGKDEVTDETRLLGKQRDDVQGSVRNLNDTHVNMRQIKVDGGKIDIDNTNEKKGDKNLLSIQNEVKSPKRYKDLSFTSRKYIMRSTAIPEMRQRVRSG